MASKKKNTKQMVLSLDEFQSLNWAEETETHLSQRGKLFFLSWKRNGGKYEFPLKSLLRCMNLPRDLSDTNVSVHSGIAELPER